MKLKLAIVALIVLAVSAYAAVTTYEVVRPAGTATISGQKIYVAAAATDTAYVDTFYSDTVDVQEAQYVNIGIQWIDATLSDSANDSLVVIVHTITSFDGGDAHILYYDTFFDTNGITTLANTYERHNLFSDTCLYNKLYFRTIIKDSVITDTLLDSNLIEMKIHVLQRPNCDY